MPRKKAVSTKKVYTSLFFKVESYEHYLGFSVAHDAERTGKFHDKISKLEISGVTSDDSTSPNKNIQLTVYEKDDLILSEEILREVVKRHMSWWDKKDGDPEVQRRDLMKRLTPDSVGYVQPHRGVLQGTVWIEPEMWRSVFNLALSGKELYVDLTGRKELPRRYMFLNHFAITTQREV